MPVYIEYAEGFTLSPAEAIMRLTSIRYRRINAVNEFWRELDRLSDEEHILHQAACTHSWENRAWLEGGAHGDYMECSTCAGVWHGPGLPPAAGVVTTRRIRVSSN